MSFWRWTWHDMVIVVKLRGCDREGEIPYDDMFLWLGLQGPALMPSCCLCGLVKVIQPLWTEWVLP